MPNRHSVRLIDATGHVWDALSWQFRDRSDAESAGVPHDLPLKMVSNSGYIGVHMTKRSVRVVLNPATVAPASIEGLVRFLHDRRPHRPPERVFCLSILDQQSPRPRLTEIYGSAKQCLNRLRFLVHECEPQTMVRFTRRNLDVVTSARTPAIARLLGIWQSRNGLLDEEAINPVLRQELGGRYWLFEHAPQRRTYAMIRIGPGLILPEPRFTNQLIGSDLTGFPDTSYATWVASTYDVAVESGQPLYDEIMADIFWPHTGFVTRQYRRLLLPWHDACGRRLLLSVNRPL